MPLPTQEAPLPQPPKPARARPKMALGCFRVMQLMETTVGRSRSRDSEAAQHWRATSCTVRDLPAERIRRLKWVGFGGGGVIFG